MLHYTIPAMILPGAARVFLLLSEAEAGSTSEDCSPTLRRFTRRVRWDWFRDRCRDATPEAVRDILNDGNSRKVFCRKTAAGSYDLFTRKQIREFVVEELGRTRPEMCR